MGFKETQQTNQTQPLLTPYGVVESIYIFPLHATVRGVADSRAALPRSHHVNRGVVPSCPQTLGMASHHTGGVQTTTTKTL